MQVAIIGLGDYGKSVATEVCALGGQSLAIDKESLPVEEMKDVVSQAVIADGTDEKAMRALGVAEVDAAIVAIGDMAQSIIVTLVLRRIGVSKIIARATTSAQAEALKAVGASRVVNIESQMGTQIARTLIAPHILDRFTVTADISLVEIRAPRPLIGKHLSETRLRENYHLNLVAVQTRKPGIDEQGKRITKTITDAAPSADFVIEEDSIMIIAGRDEDLDNFLRKE